MKNKVIVVFSSHLDISVDEKFISHIKNTIGCNYSIHRYSNNNEYSLSEIYNKALNENYCENSIFAFIHNDILFKTRNWGRVLLSRFNNYNFDIIGLAGTTKLDNDGVWWSDRHKLCGIVNHTDGDKEWESKFSPEFSGIKEVITVDGVFMAVNPDTIIHKFDEKYKGFHFYDISFCFPNYLDGCNIGVTTDIRIIHKSVGITTPEWEVNRLKFIDEYVDELPSSLECVIKDITQHNIKLKEEPLVSVIIPTKNNFDILEKNINSWKKHTKYKNYEIIIADTGSDDQVISKYENLISNKISVVRYDYYNFGRINNDVVKNHALGDFILFCNDDIELLNDCLSRVVQVYQTNKNVGTIGIRLHYGDNSVQHNGMYVRIKNGQIDLSHVDLRKTDFYNTKGYYYSAGNTGAFLFINKQLFNDLGRFNEGYIECFEDVELNLRCINRNLKNITIFDAVAYHYESVSRNKNIDKIKNTNIDYKLLIDYVNNNENR